MTPSRFVQLAVSLTLVGCTHPEPASSPPVAEATPTATVAAPAPPASAAPADPTPPEQASNPAQVATAPASAQAATPPAKAVLGVPCTASAAGTDAVEACGTKGRVSLVYASRVFMTPGPSCTLTRLHMQGMYAPSACVSGDELWAESACIVCRMMGSGWSAEGRISELTAAQAGELAKRLGLDASSAPRTAAEWQRAIAAAREKKPE